MCPIQASRRFAEMVVAERVEVLLRVCQRFGRRPSVIKVDDGMLFGGLKVRGIVESIESGVREYLRSSRWGHVGSRPMFVWGGCRAYYIGS